MTKLEAITNLEMIRAAFVEPITEEQGKLIDDTFDMAIRALKNEQTDGDLINKSVLDQIRWERDIAISQLQDLGYGFGEKPRTDGDLISRTDLLNKIWQKEYGKDYDGVNMLNIPHIDIIENMPSAEKTARWIPVSERLPEIHQDVLVSLRSLDVEIGFRAETEPYFYCSIDGCYVEPKNVIAWMPLPEPYKEECDNNHDCEHCDWTECPLEKETDGESK